MLAGSLSVIYWGYELAVPQTLSSRRWDEENRWVHAVLAVYVWVHTVLALYIWVHTVLAVYVWVHTVLAVYIWVHAVLAVYFLSI